ncbi:hypothetical protein HK101_000780 [Irineochytrium annulatum]|nr:hypothetical protein HK101_000780 [Irineochytrium annulatum]
MKFTILSLLVLSLALTATAQYDNGGYGNYDGKKEPIKIAPPPIKKPAPPPPPPPIKKQPPVKKPAPPMKKGGDGGYGYGRY